MSREIISSSMSTEGHEVALADQFTMNRGGCSCGVGAACCAACRRMALVQEADVVWKGPWKSTWRRFALGFTLQTNFSRLKESLEAGELLVGGIRVEWSPKWYLLLPFTGAAAGWKLKQED